MFCVKCSNQNPDEAQYCAKCGILLERVEASENFHPSDFDIRQMSPSYEDGGMDDFARNVLLSFAIHGVVLLITSAVLLPLVLMASGLYSMGILILLLVAVIGPLVMAGLYVYFGYRQLIFMPRLNFILLQNSSSARLQDYI